MIKRLFLTALTVGLLVLGFVMFSYLSFRGDTLDRLQAQSEVAQTDRGPVEYILEGTGEDVLLFLHGTPGGYDQRVSLSGFRVLAPSRPGYLRTPIEGGRTPQEQADTYAALLDTLAINEVLVMGASGGGPSAMAFAATYPARTRALIALEAVSNKDLALAESPGFLSRDFSSWLVLSAMKRIQGPKGLVKMLIPDPQNQERILEDEEKLDAFGGLLWTTWPPSQRSEGAVNDELQFQSLDLPLANIEAPTLAIHGSADQNVPIAQAQYLVEQVKDGRIHVIDRADHMMPFTHRDEVWKAILEFVNDLDQGPELTPESDD